MQLLCGLRMPEVGVRNVFVGLQYEHYWQNEDVVSLAQNHPNTSVILLKRDNYLAYLCAAAGTKVKKSKFLSKVALDFLPDKVKNFQGKYQRMYCALKNAGIPVMMLTYEELVENFEEKMKIVSEFIGENEDRSWYDGFVSKHKKLEGRIENLKEVKDFLAQKYPSFLCMISEDCIYERGWEGEGEEEFCKGGRTPEFVPMSTKTYFLPRKKKKRG